MYVTLYYTEKYILSEVVHYYRTISIILYRRGIFFIFDEFSVGRYTETFSHGYNFIR